MNGRKSEGMNNFRAGKGEEDARIFVRGRNRCRRRRKRRGKERTRSGGMNFGKEKKRKRERPRDREKCGRGRKGERAKRTLECVKKEHQEGKQESQPPFSRFPFSTFSLLLLFLLSFTSS